MILSAVQINIAGGRLPAPENNGYRYRNFRSMPSLKRKVHDEPEPTRYISGDYRGRDRPVHLDDGSGPTHASEAGAASSSFVPPPESSIPSGKFGDAVRLGEQVFRETATFAPEFTGNQLSCSNCHLEAGRLSGAAPMWGAYVSYPAYRSKNDHVNSFEERLQECFLYSMNGKKPGSGDPVLVALESYAYFLAKGLPTGEQVPGRGLPPLAMPAQPPDYVRGAQVFAQNCASCHGPQGTWPIRRWQGGLPSVVGAAIL